MNSLPQNHRDAEATRHLRDGSEFLLRRLEENVKATRKLEAQRLEIFREMLTIAAAEGDTMTREAVVPNCDRSELAFRALRAEVASALLASEGLIDREISLGFELINQYWPVYFALSEGEISMKHAQVIVDAGRVIGADDSVDTLFRRGAYTEKVLDLAVEMTPNRLMPLARRLAEQQAERSLDERNREARTQRRVIIQPAEDGMADLYAHLPAVEAYAIKNRLNRMSRMVERTENEQLKAERAEGAARAERASQDAEASPADQAFLSTQATQATQATPGNSTTDSRRSRSQIEADVFSDLLLGGIPEQHSGLEGVQGNVQILTRGEILLTSDEERSAKYFADLEKSAELELSANFPTPIRPDNAELMGYGPIDSESAKVVAGNTDAWNMITLHDRTTEIISVDRYRPSEQMKRILGARDQHCRFPGCRVALSRCDIDHTIDAALGGATSTDNLAHLCRGHHTLKHHTNWSVKQEPGGILQWQSPAGRTYTERPPSQVRFESDERVPF